MSILFFDTETTGLPPRYGGPGHPDQPHVVQLACILADADGTERASVSVIVKPAIPIPIESSRVHGIGDEEADRFGIPPAAALGIWSNLARRADLLVAHNLEFDIARMETEWWRAARSDPASSWSALHAGRPRFCTADAATPVVNLPPTRRMMETGFGGKPKRPKLEECVRHFFKEHLEGAHDALVDVRACMRVFFHLSSIGAGPVTAPVPLGRVA